MFDPKYKNLDELKARAERIRLRREKEEEEEQVKANAQPKIPSCGRFTRGQSVTTDRPAGSSR